MLKKYLVFNNYNGVWRVAPNSEPQFPIIISMDSEKNIIEGGRGRGEGGEEDIITEKQDLSTKSENFFFFFP